MGIAASYPNDVGIEADPSVVFVERFNSSVGTIQANFDQTGGGSFMSSVTDAPANSPDTTCLRMANTGSNLTLLLKNLLRLNASGYPTLYCRTYVKYESVGANWKHNGLWLLGQTTGSVGDADFLPSTCCSQPTGNDMFYSGMEINHPSGLGLDCYTDWMDMHSSGIVDGNNGALPSYYGNTFMNGTGNTVTLTGDTWYCFEVAITENSSSSASDGTLQAWIDGTQVVNMSAGLLGTWSTNQWTTGNGGVTPFEGFRWRQGSFNITNIFLDFDTLGAAAMRWAHLVAATSYIGPISTTTASVQRLPVGQTRISWNANTESDLAGYKLYVGRASGTYTVAGSPVNVGNVTTALYNVPDTGLWYFALTAYNTAAQESSFSDEIVADFYLPAPPTNQVARGIYRMNYR